MMDEIEAEVERNPRRPVLLCTPNNPTGDALPPEWLAALLERLEGPLLLDNAYGEFCRFDYRPLLPWFGVVLLGVALGQWLYPQARRVVELPDLSRFAPIAFLGLLGRRSLAIYLVHQPLLLGVLALLGAIEL